MSDIVIDDEPDYVRYPVRDNVHVNERDDVTPLVYDDVTGVLEGRNTESIRFLVPGCLVPGGLVPGGLVPGGLGV